MAASSILQQNPGFNVDKYISDELQPNEAFHRPYNRDIDALATLIKSELPRVLPYGFTVQKIIKSGSLGKGTAVKGNVDLDLVIFLNGFRNQKDFNARSSEFLTILDRFLKNAGRLSDMSVQVEEISSSGAVQFKFRLTQGGRQWHDVDIMLAFDNICHLGSLDRVHREMRNESPDVRKTYAASLTEEQLKCVKSKPVKVKDLIRLVKHWKDTHVNGIESPKSYAMELLTIEAWEDHCKITGGSLQDFNMGKGFYHVLKKLEAFGKIWREKSHLPGILINDIADSFSDVSRRYDYWEELGQNAGRCSRQKLFSDISQTDRSWY